MKTFAEAEQRLAQVLPGYTERPQQQRLAAAVENLFAAPDTPVTLLGEAGCGTGKSIASVVPAVLARKVDEETGKIVPQRIVVATATKALQEQYAGKDLPFLQANLGVPFTWALLKGRSNYVCHAKLSEVTTLDLPNIEQIRAELEDETHSGDFEHLANPVPEEKKHLLSTSSAECPGKTDCPFGKICFAERAKEVAKESNVVITNTAMLMTDLKIREISDGQVAMLGEYDGVIIDEAHEVPEIAASALADQFSRRGIENTISGAENFLGEQDGPSATQLAGELRGNVEAIWTHLEGLAQGEQVELKLDELAAHLEPYIELVEGLRMLEGMVSGAQIKNGHPVRETARQRRTARRIISLAQKLTEFLTGEGLVRWIETEERGKGRNRRQITVLKYSPIEVGPFLNRFLWTRVPAALVSATLSVGGDFSYISETLGLEDPVTLDVGTPFDYEKQAKLFVPAKGQPDPSRQRSQWLSYAQNTTRDLIQAAGGGALLLFTSRRAMHDSYEMLRDVLEMAGYTCLMQGEHGTNKEIAARFSEDTHSVLFALKSFFTGVDFAGETCRLVVIDKLPFPVPTDILYAARAAKVDRQYGDWASFNRLSIPMMSLTLTQGFGRLIRSVNDRGVVAILDPRLTSKGYGKRILAALPPAPMTHDLAEVADFYAA